MKALNHQDSSRSSGRNASVLPLLRRILHPSQMDLEYTSWMMLQLCVSPKIAYRHTSYHRQTKNQWSRDDPAFVIATSALVAVAATSYCITFGQGFWSSLYAVASAVVVDFLLVGSAIATLAWLVANRFLRKHPTHQQIAEQPVEWLYAFDVHCNSYLPLFLLLYVVQHLLSPLLLWHGFLPTLLSICLYTFALSYYHYLNWLGYSALPSLERTEVFLWPIAIVCAAAGTSLIFQFNPSRYVLGLYFDK